MRGNEENQPMRKYEHKHRSTGRTGKGKYEEMMQRIFLILMPVFRNSNQWLVEQLNSLGVK